MDIQHAALIFVQKSRLVLVEGHADVLIGHVVIVDGGLN